MQKIKKITVTGRFCFIDNSWVINPSLPDNERESIGSSPTYKVLRLMNPDIDGFSKMIPLSYIKDNIEQKYHNLLGGNGSNMFSRMLGKDFNFVPKESYESIGRKKISRRCYGLIHSTKISQAIRQDIVTTISKLPCALTGISSNIEADHKDGRKGDQNVGDLSTQLLSDFQPLTKSVNVKKRESCKSCEKTNQRYKATNLGYSANFTHGGLQYEGTCKGCFFYDVMEFKKEISEGFNQVDLLKKQIEDLKEQLKERDQYIAFKNQLSV